MFEWVLSDDKFNSRILAATVMLITICLALAPIFFPGTKSMNVAARICIFIVLVASFDLLLGYTGIVSFAHNLFFGIGAYSVALSIKYFGPTWGVIGLGTLVSLIITIIIALGIAFLSLRVQALFFAMITLAVGSFFMILASKTYEITGGEDGLNIGVPELLSPAYRIGDFITGRTITYYFIFVCSVILFLMMLRLVNSSFGNVLKAIRENEFRAEAVGFRVLFFRVISICVGSGIASLAGVLYILWLRYTGPETTLSFHVATDILLMVVIGGMGSMYGAILGATILVIAQYYLQSLMEVASSAMEGIPILPILIHEERWLLWLGILFILVIYFFPSGIVGKLRALRASSDSTNA